MADISIDLHLHFDGSISMDNAKKLARMQKIAIPNDKDLKQLLTVDVGCKSLAQYLGKFDFPLSLLQTEKAIEEGMYTLCIELLAECTAYAEIRFAPQLHINKGLTQEQIVQAAINGFKRSKICGGLILCIMRGSGNEVQNRVTVDVAEKYLNNGVLALDLAGNEADYATKNFKELLGIAKDKHIPFTLHAGEAAGADSIKQALSLGAARIGHGVRSVEDKRLIELLAARKIPLELCPTSNLNTALFEKIEDYPIRVLMSAGVAVTVNSDNRSVSNTTARKELELLKKVFLLTEDEEKQLLENAVHAAFCHEATKKKLLEMI